MAKKPKKWVLKGNKMMCPKCEGTKCLSRNEYVARNVYIDVDENGQWDWSGDDDTHWETSEHIPELGELEWRCRDCDIEFEAPNVKNRYEVEVKDG